MFEEFPEKLKAKHLMTHMHVLCKEIGPRPSTSAQERQAAEYVKETLQRLGFRDIQEQIFKSQNSMGWITITSLLLATLAMLIAWLGGQWGKLIGGLLLAVSVYTNREFLLAKPPFFQRFIARGLSQNIIARISPSGPVRQKIHLMGHLDTQKQRFLTPPPNPGQMKFNGTWLIVVPAIGGLLFWGDILLHRQGIVWWQWLIGAALLFTLFSILFEERQPHIEGANDNATAVAVLLGIAEALQAHPLQHTEVTLLFTGCEEVVCVGIENYLRQFVPAKNTYWIDLEMVGTGGLCYVTKHGVSYLTTYFPTADLVGLAVQAAHKYPELAVTGKEMVILEETANLRRRGYWAICLAGYDEKGFLPNWHRLSDTLENIEPDTLSRAAHFTWALMQEIKNLPTRDGM